MVLCQTVGTVWDPTGYEQRNEGKLRDEAASEERLGDAEKSCPRSRKELGSAKLICLCQSSAEIENICETEIRRPR